MSEKLTAAQKGAATRAEKAARQRQEDIAFVAAHIGPRPAKQAAQKNAIWNDQSSTSRKRTSSTAQASKTTKKARVTTTEADQEDDEPAEESQVKSKSVSRKFAAPPINIDSESEPEELKKVPLVRIDFTDFPLPKAKAKTAKAAPKGKPAKIVNVPVKAKLAVIRKPVKMVADSASEAEDKSQPSGDEESGDADNSDEGDADSEDNAGPNAQEFADEVPQVIRTRARATAAGADEGDEVSEAEAGLEGFQSDQSRELDVIAPKSKGKGIKKSIKPAEDLFVSEEEEAAPAPKRSIWAQAHRRTGSRQSVNSDIMMDEAIADELSSIPLYTHSRRGSTASGWSSGRDLTIPTSEPESDAASEPEIGPNDLVYTN
ncbi:hypothetical protein B0H13DRAFT_2305170 [Mycena leptocephala]|nr:hypothetical protein B0H13DRAFT_2305170 [Mycena leptocephala]